MKKIVIHAGFHPEVPREYNGEHIFQVVNFRSNVESHDFHDNAIRGSRGDFYGLDNNVWIKSLGDDRYVSDWTDEERWGRAEEIETDEQGTVLSARDVGFVLLRVDRSRGLL